MFSFVNIFTNNYLVLKGKYTEVLWIDLERISKSYLFLSLLVPKFLYFFMFCNVLFSSN